MKYVEMTVCTQEVPDEISLCLTISGCRLRCDGCHSPYLWKEHGMELSEDVLLGAIRKYSGMLSCVLFMGGEWYEDELVGLLRLSKTYNLKTCLYTGEDDVSDGIKANLDYLKTGRWISNLGGLDCDLTNQKFINVVSGEDIGWKFKKNGGQHPPF